NLLDHNCRSAFSRRRARADLATKSGRARSVSKNRPIVDLAHARRRFGMRLSGDWISDTRAMGPSARTRYSDRESHRRSVERVCAPRSPNLDRIADWRRNDRLLTDRAKIAFG